MTDPTNESLIREISLKVLDLLGEAVLSIGFIRATGLGVLFLTIIAVVALRRSSFSWSDLVKLFGGFERRQKREKKERKESAPLPHREVSKDQTPAE